ncbi:hypothetical protein HNR06_004964 [Nocardiopsis arvandica]|uniref:Uncharacterized protein n=1 Tax=Nocardiopsis sinuspersici TaxID=501010 RepID=A0A7Y9XIT6_9ACTN|nr:hypothetical protein [Nocardiopsis sinuspersici]NYH55375.1 hypothetical protein [Nocardiopsis sinuspersici]
MNTTTRRLLAATTLTTALAMPTPAHAATDYPGHTTSSYIVLTDTTTTQAHQHGCAEGRTGTTGPRILFFGTQEKNDTLREPGRTASSPTPRAPYTQAAQYAHHWARGFTECRTDQATAHLALGVNNKDDSGLTGTHAGQRWAHLVTTARDNSTTDAVTITTALDAEPSWSTPRWARDWLTAYTKATDVPLYAANSADSCPTTTSGDCANGWTLADVHHMAGAGNPRIHVIPQIYRTDGIQARQWANISRWGHTHTGDPLRFAGAMSQHTACSQRSCNNTDNTPQQAWAQLKKALDAHHSTRVNNLGPATDMRWP